MSDSCNSKSSSSGSGGTPAACTTAACTCKTTAAIDKIAVKVKATPALTPRPGAVAPADHDFDCTETAEAFPADKSLVVMRGDMQDVELKATVRPAGTPVWWDVRRAPDDHATLGGAADLPTLIVDAGDHTKATLKLDKKGSFFVRVFADCTNSHVFDPGSAFRLLPTVLVDATLNADNTVTSTATPPITPAVAGSNVRINTGTFNIANVRSGVDTAAIYMNAAVDVKSGGPDGRRLLDCVFAGWINNLRSTTRSGQYAGPPRHPPPPHHPPTYPSWFWRQTVLRQLGPQTLLSLVTRHRCRLRCPSSTRDGPHMGPEAKRRH